MKKRNDPQSRCACGKGGIRTLGTVTRTYAFQAYQLNHSCTFPVRRLDGRGPQKYSGPIGSQTAQRYSRTADGRVRSIDASSWVCTGAAARCSTDRVTRFARRAPFLTRDVVCKTSTTSAAKNTPLASVEYIACPRSNSAF